MNLRNMGMMTASPSLIAFHPKTYILPMELRRLKKDWLAKRSGEEQDGEERLWIMKPPASARGNGIKVIRNCNEIPKAARIRDSPTKSQLIVQEYIANPCLLFNGTKFDLRLYVLITSFAPLRVYLFKDGLVRFASHPYSSEEDKLADEFVHLTNYSINKKSSSYEANHDVHGQGGHKWTLKTFWKSLERVGRSVEPLQEEITSMILTTIFSCRRPVNRLIKKHLKSRYTSFELLGFDVMLDENLRPWLLEVNVSPSLRSESWLDTTVKGRLIKDTFNLVGFQLPPNEDEVGKGFGINKQLHTFALNKAEREKQTEFGAGCDLPAEMLENLTGDDVRVLMETEDELRRIGTFERLWPCKKRKEYLRLVNEVPYYEKLTMSWEERYGGLDSRLEAIKALQSLNGQALGAS